MGTMGTDPHADGLAPFQVPKEWPGWISEFLWPAPGVKLKNKTRSRALHPKPIRAQFSYDVGGLCVQLGAQIFSLAAYVWIGLLRHRNDCLDDDAV